MNKKKILITGFPHCGTTIIRAKVGECKNVYEQTMEFETPQHFSENGNYDFYVWKHPYLNAEFRNNSFSIKPTSSLKDVYIIPIIRNPWNVFSSMYRKSKLTNDSFSIYNNNQGFSLSYYQNAAEVIYDAMQNNYDGVYPIRYEDIFKNNFQALKDIFNKIGLEYDDSIFQSRTKEYTFNNCKLSNEHNSSLDYDRFDELRTWQINQPMENMNSSIELPEDFSKMIEKLDIVHKLGYSDPRITG